MNSEQDDGLLVVRLGVPMLVLPWIFTGLRFWSRAVASKGKYGIDDWTCFAATIVNTPLVALYIYTVQLGIGRHNSVPSQDLKALLHVIFASYCLFASGRLLSKISALTFFGRIFSSSTPFRRLLWLTGILCSASWMYFLTYKFARCRPVRKAWDSDVTGHCIDPSNFVIADTVWDVLLDLTILILPLPMIWKLQMPPGRKWLLTALFVVGYSSIVTSIGRAGAILANRTRREDYTHEDVSTFSWTIVQVPCCIIVICIPSVFHLLKRGANNGVQYLFIAGDLPPHRHMHLETSHRRRHGSELDTIPLTKISQVESPTTPSGGVFMTVDSEISKSYSECSRKVRSKADLAV